MPKEPTLTEQTKKVFKETVDIYRNDLYGIFNNPWPFVVAIAALILFALIMHWL